MRQAINQNQPQIFLKADLLELDLEVFIIMPTKLLTLSIVIPVYNEQRYLAACLESIKNQSLKPNEVIVVNNNSTDKSVQIARRFSFVKIINEPKQGVPFARSRGFDIAKGDIIARIDADSCLPTDWLKRVAQKFADPAVAAVTGPAGGYDMPLTRLNWLPHHLLCLMLYYLPPGHPFLFGFNMALRRTTWLQVRPNICDSTQLHEDLDLAIHLCQQNLKIKYSARLKLGASGRRYSDHFADFRKYIRVYRQTFKRHGHNDWLVYLASFVYLAGYIAYRPWARRSQPRQHPMGF